ncbi:MAG: clathrin assembly factor [Trebouxia sp. A1-2]|nr:MAG: clathrin assembly factor [Trebouxia sp. A1-2]
MATSTLSTADKTRQAARQMMRLAADKTKIATARTMKGETHEIDIAVVKSTAAQFHVVPKEKHVRTLKNCVHPARPRREVQYVISELVHRLHHANDWLTALKTLMVMHRLMRESNISFVEELLKYSETVTQGKGHVLNMDNFIDTTNIEGRFEYSEWVRAYGKYLDEQLEVYHKIAFYQEQEHSGEQSRLRQLPAQELLFQMPFLQKLLRRLLDCKPTGAASHDAVQSLLTILKESFKVYKAISEGLINLADRFFEMEYLDAHKGLEVYKESIVANDRLQQYYQQIEQIEELRRAIQFPKLESPPADFLTQMEAYAKEAPRPYDESSGAVTGSKKRSPPLRRGTRSKVAGKEQQDGYADMKADPGMVLNYKAAEEVQPQPAAPQPDLLDFDGLSMDAPPAQANGGPSNASYTDLLAEVPAAPPVYESNGGTQFGGQQGGQQGGQFGGQQGGQFGGQQGGQFGGQQGGQFGGQQAGHYGAQQGGQNPFGAPAGPAPASNPFAASSGGGGYQGQGGQSGYGQQSQGGFQQQGFGGAQGGYGQGQGMASQAPQGGFSSQNGSPFNSMTAGTTGTSPLAQAPPSGWGGGQQQQGVSQQTPPRAPTRKEAAAVHDPFAALTGLPHKDDSRPSPPLRASPANSYTAGQPSYSQGAQSNLSPAAAGAGGIGRGGTPVVGSYRQGEAPASSPAPFSGFGPTAGSQMTNNPGTGNATVSVGPAAQKVPQGNAFHSSFAQDNSNSLI